MPKAKPSSFNPLRIISPAMLMFCFVLFFLPWIELQCVIPQDKAKSIPKEKLDEAKKELGFDPTKPVSMVSQSGLQIATGDSSPGSDMKRIEAKMKEEMKGMGGEVKTEKSKDKDDIKGAPLLFLYPVLLLAGIAIPFLPIPGMIRSIAGAGCCGAALALILLQAAIGFPMENEIKKKNDEMKGGMGGGFGFGMGPPPGEKAGAKDAKAATKEPEIFRVSWQFSLYLTLLLLLGAAGTAFLGGLDGMGGKGKYGRKKSRDDYDEDEDEEDDRPRKKSRRDEEEDEDRPRKKRRDEDDDDRPRKKRRDEEEDEDERPRKKSRRDEDDEDDRPRKKKPLEPEFEMPAPLPPPPPAAPPPPAGPNPFAFDEDEPAPKKKPRRRDDDDDYDDRPRKKRRRDED